MGDMFGAAPEKQGPSAAEQRLEAAANKRIAASEKKKKDDAAQAALNLRGRRSLLSEKNTGSGFKAFAGPVVGGS